MKKIVLLLTVMIAMVACEDKVKEIDKGKLDPDATILIRPGKGVKTRALVSDLTAQQVVENTINIKFTSHYFSNKYEETALQMGRGFADAQRDLSIPALKMWGTDIIAQDGSYYRDFIYGTEVYLTDNNNDTIAYIPQSVIDNARTLIEAAYQEQNYTEVYRVFDKAFTFLPISNK